MSKTDQRGARLRRVFRDTRELLAGRGELAGTPEIVRHLRYVEPVTLEPGEEDWLWDGGWESRTKEAIRGTSVGGVRAIHSVRSNGRRVYEQLVLLTYEQGCQVRDSYRATGAADFSMASGWDRVLEVWSQRGEHLVFGEAIDADEYGRFVTKAESA